MEFLLSIDAGDINADDDEVHSWTDSDHIIIATAASFVMSRC
jgi:hypothetical protein